MSPLDLSKLSGPDAIVALRSYPRRFRELLAPIPDEPDLDELAHRVGPDGRSAIEFLHTFTNTLTLLGQALRQVLVHDDPVLHPAVADVGARAWELPPELTVDGQLTDLGAETDSFVAEADRIEGADWNRSGAVAGGATDGRSTMTAIDIVREAVQAGASALEGARTALAAARR